MYPKSMKAALFAAAVITAPANPSLAESVKIGDLVIKHPIARETAPASKVGVGFLKIKNKGTTSERLIGGKSDFAGDIQVHQMKMENDVMKMSEVETGLEIPPGELVILKPGGYHIMFMKLDGPLKAGEKRKVQLNFAKAGSVDVTFSVKSLADTMKLQHSH